MAPAAGPDGAVRPYVTALKPLFITFQPGEEVRLSLAWSTKVACLIDRPCMVKSSKFVHSQDAVFAPVLKTRLPGVDVVDTLAFGQLPVSEPRLFSLSATFDF